jgi:3-(3-hydroxy-phenyl)propionate hydroxylase
VSRVFQPYPFVPQRHEARLPALVGGADPARHPVAIVGGGIAGLASAVGLASYGIRSVVLEADDSVCVGSRAICISRRSLEILARFGVLEPFLAKGLAWTGGRSFFGNAEVLQFSMPHDQDQRLPPMVNIQQYYIEQFLLESAAKSGLVEVRWQNRVKRITATPDGVSLTVDTPLGGYELAADWLLGCDGARSIVREATGMKLEGTSYEGRYVIVDVLLRSHRPTERLAWFDPPSNPGSTILMHRQPDDVWRIDYQLRDDEDPEEAVRPENVISRVASHLRMIGERDDWAPIWISLYKANALTLETYRKDRLLLAGDAAHLVPIFGVRGANSAFEDADNLAWKLALILRGMAGETLLESYSTERVYAARENLSQGMKSTEFMSPPSFGFSLMRTAVLGLAIEHAFVRPLINPRQTQAIGYAQSPLNGPSVGDFGSGPAPGCVARECPLTLFGRVGPRAGHVTDILEPGFNALCFTEEGAIPNGFGQLERLLRASGVPFSFVSLSRDRPTHGSSFVGWDHTGRLFPLYGATPGTVYLMRPDGYVLARWRHATPGMVHHAIERTLNLSHSLSHLRESAQ